MKLNMFVYSDLGRTLIHWAVLLHQSPLWETLMGEMSGHNISFSPDKSGENHLPNQRLFHQLG